MSEKIEKLTPEKEALIPQYIERYTKIGLSTERCDRAKGEDAIRALYKQMGFGEIKHFYWFENPFSACELAAQFAKKEALALGEDEKLKALQFAPPTRAELADQAAKASYGSHEAYWVAFYDFVQSELDYEPHPLVDICKQIVLNCGIFWTFEGHVIISEKPKSITIKDNKLHSYGNTPALEYYDGTQVFAKDGKVFSSLMEMAMEEKMGG